jgi:hypothetical protein
MTPERHRQIGDLYHEALQIDADRRPDFLHQVCGNDEELLREIESLLAYQDRAQSFIESPAWEVAAVAFAEESSNEDRTRTREESPDLKAESPRVKRRGIRIRIGRPGIERDKNPKRFATPRLSQPLQRRRYHLIIVVAIALSLIGATIALIKWRYSSSQREDHPSSETGSMGASERSLSYTLMVRRDPQRDPGGKPFLSLGAIALSDGDLVRFQIRSPQDGFLYILNEGPQYASGRPQFNVLFPEATVGGDSAEIRADVTTQIPLPSDRPDLDWFLFDAEKGIEKVWLVWAASRVPELEAAKIWANPQDKGGIKDPQQIEAVTQYLTLRSTTDAQSTVDETNKQTTLKGKGEVLIALLRLAHR